MVDRLSVNLLLKSVIAILARRWCHARAEPGIPGRGLRRLRIAAVAEASAHLFTALHNLRVDRVLVPRPVADQCRRDASANARSPDSEMPALKSVWWRWRRRVSRSVSRRRQLAQAMTKLTSLHEESAPAFRGRRRNGGRRSPRNSSTRRMPFWRCSTSCRPPPHQLVKLEDAYVDQLMELKQHAWVVRNAGGDASVMISDPLGGQPLSAGCAAEVCGASEPDSIPRGARSRISLPDCRCHRVSPTQLPRQSASFSAPIMSTRAPSS